jgi:hypothetical protein
MQAVSLDNAAAELRTVLPPQLRSLRVVGGSNYDQLSEQTAALASSFWAALGDMPHLTELSIQLRSEFMYVRPELEGLLHLRKLTLGPAGGMGDHVAELKQLSQLRELILLEDRPDRIRLLCQPPHALQLESIILPSILLGVDEETMRAVVHLPTLTALDAGRMSDNAWPLLPQLPRLRRLSIDPCGSLSSGRMVPFCESLLRCTLLEDLTLRNVYLEADGPEADIVTAEQQRAGWAALLSSVANLRRLDVDGHVTHLLPMIPLHLPLLEELSLCGWGDRNVDHFASLAHPNVRLLELGWIDMHLPSADQLHSYMHSAQFPKLERCICRALGHESVGCRAVAETGRIWSVLR